MAVHLKKQRQYTVMLDRLLHICYKKIYHVHLLPELMRKKMCSRSFYAIRQGKTEAASMQSALHIQINFSWDIPWLTLVMKLTWFPRHQHWKTETVHIYHITL